MRLNGWDIVVIAGASAVLWGIWQLSQAAAIIAGGAMVLWVGVKASTMSRAKGSRAGG